MAEDSIQALRAEMEKNKQQFEQIINNHSKQKWSLQQELAATKEKLETSESKVEQLEAENSRLKPKQGLAIKTCDHVKEDGYGCGSPAVTGRCYCRYHLGIRGRRLKMARARARRERWVVEVPPLENLYAVQVAAQNMLEALASGQLDRRLGNTMLHGLQLAYNNLRQPRAAWDDSDRFDDVGKTTVPDFERAHGLPEGFDVDTPPEEAFPMPVTASDEIELTGEETGSEGGQELKQLLARDPEAGRRRARELVRKYRRRVRYDEERLEQALAMLEASQPTAEAHQPAPVTAKAEAATPQGGPANVSTTAQAAAVAAGAISPQPGGAEAKKAPQAEPGAADEGGRRVLS